MLNSITTKATECLTTVKKVNKTDAATLLNNFKVCPFCFSVRYEIDSWSLCVCACAHMCVCFTDYGEGYHCLKRGPGALSWARASEGV